MSCFCFRTPSAKVSLEPEDVVENQAGGAPAPPPAVAVVLNSSTALATHQRKAAPPIQRLGKQKCPVRLLLAEKISTLHPVLPYELLPSECFIECSFEDFMAEKCHETAVISWRWAKPKPASLELAKGEDGNLVPRSLIQHVASVVDKDHGLKYVWLDWACVMQYPPADKSSATMEEINRSGFYYKSSRTMITWCFDELDEDRLLARYSSYFSRAWTLCERLWRMSGEMPLTLSSFLPLYLQPSSGICLFEDAAADRLVGGGDGEQLSILWHKSLIEITSLVQELSGGGGDDGNNPNIIMRIMELVGARWPRLLAVRCLVSNHLSQLEDALSSELLRAALDVRAVCEWLRPAKPFKDKVELGGGHTGVFSWKLKVMLLSEHLQNTRKVVDNMNHDDRLNEARGEEARAAVLDAWVAATNAMAKCAPAPSFGATDAGAPDDQVKMQVVAELCGHAAKLWELATMRPMTEIVDAAWLRKYLVYEVGVRYVAFERRDLLNAVKNLFSLEDVPVAANDEQAARLWSKLAEKAGIERGGPYAWLWNLSRPGEDLSLIGCHVTLFKRPTPDPDLIGTSCGQFGIYAHDSGDVLSNPAVRAYLALPFRAALALPRATFGASSRANPSGSPQTVQNDELLTNFLVGARLDVRAARGLRNGSADLERLDLSGDRRDCPLSLRGRTALRSLEERLHKTVHALAKGAATDETANALFLVFRYCGAGLQHARVLLLWCGLHPTEDEWCVRACASIGAAPQKGGSWGVQELAAALARSLQAQTKVADAVAVEHLEPSQSYSCSAISSNDAWVGALDACTGQRQPWWTTWPISLSNAGTSPCTNDEATADLAPEAVLAEYVAGSKTMFTERDLQLVRACLQLFKQQGVSANSLKVYYDVLQSNYVHDSVMAKHLEYFESFCREIATHVAQVPAVGKTPMIARRYSEFIEDFRDAIDMADGDAAASAREALIQLTNACDEAGIDF